MKHAKCKGCGYLTRPPGRGYRYCYGCICDILTGNPTGTTQHKQHAAEAARRRAGRKQVKARSK